MNVNHASVVQLEKLMLAAPHHAIDSRSAKGAQSSGRDPLAQRRMQQPDRFDDLSDGHTTESCCGALDLGKLWQDAGSGGGD